MRPTIYHADHILRPLHTNQRIIDSFFSTIDAGAQDRLSLFAFPISWFHHEKQLICCVGYLHGRVVHLTLHFQERPISMDRSFHLSIEVSLALCRLSWAAQLARLVNWGLLQGRSG